jgi:hypothetical protein
VESRCLWYRSFFVPAMDLALGVRPVGYKRGSASEAPLANHIRGADDLGHRQSHHIAVPWYERLSGERNLSARRRLPVAERRGHAAIGSRGRGHL